jgi:hypothetical protein
MENETVEIRNETDKPILASACRSKMTGKLYIHIGKKHGNEVKIKPHYYDIVDVNLVEI